jgi:hypothetical protein
MSTKSERVTLTLRIPQELHASVRKLAGDNDQSINNFIIQSLSKTISTIDVPLSVVENDEGDLVYVLPVSPEWYAISHCGTSGSDGSIHFCIDCQRSLTKEIEGCGKKLD